MRFTPDRMYLTVEADISELYLRRKVERTFAKNYPGSPVEAASFLTAPSPSFALIQESMQSSADSLSLGTPFDLSVPGKHHQANCIIGCSAYSLYDERRYPLILLNNMNETEARVPMSDWVYAEKPKHVGFRARSVVGGYFIKLLSDRIL